MKGFIALNVSFHRIDLLVQSTAIPNGNHKPGVKADIQLNQEKDDADHCPTKNLRMLIVDDNMDDLELALDLAKELEMRCAISTSGVEAMERLREADVGTPFDCLLIDYRLPRFNGLEVCKQLKYGARLKKMPKIILVSVYAKNSITELQANNNLVDGFVQKPIYLDKLRSAIINTQNGLVDNGMDRSFQVLTPDESVDETLAALHVLVVDDNIINQKVAEAILKNKQIKTTVARNGEEAVNTILKSPLGTYDVVLMDLDMPIMDGYEASQILNSTPGYGNLPIVALTSHIAQPIKRRCFEAGMIAFLSKPITPETLYNTILTIVKRKCQ
jgi:CheY-like chemotaxis protein